MMQRILTLPAEMTRNNVSRIGILFDGTLNGLFPCRDIGIGEVAEAIILNALYKAAAVQDLSLWAPDNDIVRRMAGTWIEGLECIRTGSESGVFGKGVLCLWFAFLLA